MYKFFSICMATACGLAGVNQIEAAPGGADFSIAILPDTQYYTSGQLGGTNAMFVAQTDWIKNNRVSENIAYVIHLGDCSDHGDQFVSEWTNATTAMYSLESPVSIPYGMAVGNHDQTPNQGFPLTDTTLFYNQYFGVAHFSGRPYYGGHYSSNNDSHYDLFTAGGLNFIVIYIEYDSHAQDWAGMNDWADGLLAANATRKAIIVTHFMIDNGNPGPFSAQGQAIYNRMRARPNVVLMLGGHIAGNGEGQRRDVYQGKVVQSFLSDYQGRLNGGNGLMRVMKFSPVSDTFSVKTFSPFTVPTTNETDADSDFSRPFLQHLPKRVCYLGPGGATARSLFNNGVWKVYNQSNVTNGVAGDIPVPGDYDGDGQTDYAVWHPTTGEWIVPGKPTVAYGQAGDIPVPGDYDGDGITDYAVFRPGSPNSTWFVLKSSTGISSSFGYGNATDIPVPGDYDGDGKSDYAVYRPGSPDSTWYIYGLTAQAYGTAGDIPVPGDYNGDGITDRAVWRPSTGQWFRLGTSSVYGQLGDIPCPGDYNGDGTNDVAVWRPSTNQWFTLGTTIGIGGSGDKPLPLPYCIRKFFFP